MFQLSLTPFFSSHSLSSMNLILMFLVGYIGLITFLYSQKYLAGDRNKDIFFKRFLILILSSVTMLLTDNLILFYISSCISNVTLAYLMMHKEEWKAAKESSRVAMRNFTFAHGMLALALYSIYAWSGSTSIHQIQNTWNFSGTDIPSLLLLLSAISQSALWPFHRWLLSSLNSPTPVSALMHAGFINGGGILLCKFSTVFSESTLSMNILFILGTATAILGTFWKLIQSDIKRMLACSTTAQMGFMLAQCGLGLFSAAVAHLFLHGLCKAYLFLSSASVAEEKRYVPSKPSRGDLVKSFLCGIVGMFVFSSLANENLFVLDTSIVLSGVVLITCVQISLTIIKETRKSSTIRAIGGSVFFGGVYGLLIGVFHNVLPHEYFWKPLDLNIFHVVALLLYGGLWLVPHLCNVESLSPQYKSFLGRIYVKLLNSSQPYPETVTTFRNKYSY